MNRHEIEPFVGKLVHIMNKNGNGYLGEVLWVSDSILKLGVFRAVGYGLAYGGKDVILSLKYITSVEMRRVCFNEK